MGLFLLGVALKTYFQWKMLIYGVDMNFKTDRRRKIVVIFSILFNIFPNIVNRLCRNSFYRAHRFLISHYTEPIIFFSSNFRIMARAKMVHSHVKQSNIFRLALNFLFFEAKSMRNAGTIPIAIKSS